MSSSMIILDMHMSVPVVACMFCFSTGSGSIHGAGSRQSAIPISASSWIADCLVPGFLCRGTTADGGLQSLHFVWLRHCDMPIRKSMTELLVSVF